MAAAVSDEIGMPLGSIPPAESSSNEMPDISPSSPDASGVEFGGAVVDDAMVGGDQSISIDKSLHTDVHTGEVDKASTQSHLPQGEQPPALQPEEDDDVPSKACSLTGFVSSGEQDLMSQSAFQEFLREVDARAAQREARLAAFDRGDPLDDLG